MFIGADPAANLLEIGGVDTSDGPIIVHAIPARFEAHEPGDDVHDATQLRLVREAFLARAAAERALGDAVIRARHNGHSWASIGTMVGTSGEAARQRYGQSVNAS